MSDFPAGFSETDASLKACWISHYTVMVPSHHVESPTRQPCLYSHRQQLRSAPTHSPRIMKPKRLELKKMTIIIVIIWRGEIPIEKEDMNIHKTPRKHHENHTLVICKRPMTESVKI